MDDERMVLVRVKEGKDFTTDAGRVSFPGDEFDLPFNEAVLRYAEHRVELLGRIGPDIPDAARRWLLVPTTGYTQEHMALVSAVVKAVALSKVGHPDRAKAADDMERKAQLYAALIAPTYPGQVDIVSTGLEVVRRVLWENEEIRRYGEAAFSRMEEG